MGRDGSSPFLNPATMGRISDHRVAFSVHFYRYTAATVEGLVRAPDGAAEGPWDIKQSSLSALPSSFCVFATLAGLIPEEARGAWRTVRGSSGRTKLGICGATLEREQLTLEAESRRVQGAEHSTWIAYNMNRTWQRQTLGPALSYQLTDRLTLGASLQVITTTAQQTWDLAAMTDEQASTSYSHHLKGSSVDGATTVGITWSQAPLWLGASLRLPSVAFSDSVRMTHFAQAASDRAQLSVGSGTFAAPLPPVLTLGTGLERDAYSLEFDFATTFGEQAQISTHLFEQGQSELSPQPRTSRATIVSAVAFRAGAEWFLSPSLSLLAGARYEPRLVRDSLDDATYGLAPVDRRRLAVSLGAGSYGKGSELAAGFELSHGWAKVPIVGSIGTDTTHVRANQRDTSLILVLTGSVGLSSVRQAYRNIKQLRPKPH